ncbi:MAG: hypothetical protein U1B30_15975 [Pseudomonadota bacterium]|nr:hypothetical protein [Pseudomonadota bacterium]
MAERKPEPHTVQMEPENVVSCDNCAFTYAGYHTIGDGSQYSCPECQGARLEKQVQELLAAAEAALKSLEGQRRADQSHEDLAAADQLRVAIAKAKGG